MLGMNLVTPQTGPSGRKVNKILIAQDVYYKGDTGVKEFYISILLNRKKGRFVIMYSPQGGMDIEQVAEKTPGLIFTEGDLSVDRSSVISGEEHCLQSGAEG